MTNNSIKHQSFVYIQLNDQTGLLQTMQFIISHLFVHNLNVKQWIGPNREKQLMASLDPGAMAISVYSAFSKAPAFLEAYHQIA